MEQGALERRQVEAGGPPMLVEVLETLKVTQMYRNQ